MAIGEPPEDEPSRDAHYELPPGWEAVSRPSASPLLPYEFSEMMEKFFTSLPAAAVVTAPTPSDVALFYRLVEVWHKMWDDAGRYGPAGLKLRRGLIAFLVLITVTFILDVAIAQANLTDHQLAEVTLAATGTAVVMAATKK